MNAEQLWDTTMNADTRTLCKCKTGRCGRGRYFHDADGRKRRGAPEFIEDNALEVVNLDI